MTTAARRLSPPNTPTPFAVQRPARAANQTFDDFGMHVPLLQAVLQNSQLRFDPPIEYLFRLLCVVFGVGRGGGVMLTRQTQTRPRLQEERSRFANPPQTSLWSRDTTNIQTYDNTSPLLALTPCVPRFALPPPHGAQPQGLAARTATRRHPQRTTASYGAVFGICGVEAR